MNDCTNPAKPCHLHDPESTRLEFGQTRTVSAGWLAGAGFFAILLTGLEWFARLP